MVSLACTNITVHVAIYELLGNSQPLKCVCIISSSLGGGGGCYVTPIFSSFPHSPTCMVYTNLMKKKVHGIYYSGCD